MFLPDSSRFYYDELEDPKLLQYVPNSNHFVDEVSSVLVYFHAITSRAALTGDSPRFSFDFAQGNTKTGTIGHFNFRAD